jgi:hypothetical protein
MTLLHLFSLQLKDYAERLLSNHILILLLKLVIRRPADLLI